jgi:hypothetical protein
MVQISWNEVKKEGDEGKLKIRIGSRERPLCWATYIFSGTNNLPYGWIWDDTDSITTARKADGLFSDTWLVVM